MPTNLKISATILLIQDDYENLKKTINSLSNELDNIFVISNKQIKYSDLNFELLYNKNFNGDFSSFRNSFKDLLPNHLLFHINCGETLITKNIKDYLEEKNYNINVFYNKFSIKETRITTKNNFIFKNKVYEMLDCNNISNSIIKIDASKTSRLDLTEYLSEWQKKEPLNNQVYYYKALNYLHNQNYNQFISDSEKLLFKSALDENNELLIRYYLANVFLFKVQSNQKFIENILTLIAKKPEMSEFWCLAGDYWYTKNNFKNAKIFYKYALIASNHRDYEDGMFTIEDKYQDYPKKMIENCNKIIEKSENIFLKQNI